MTVFEIAVFGVGVGLLAMAVDHEVRRLGVKLNSPKALVNVWVDQTKREPVDGWNDASTLEQAKAMISHGDVAMISLGGEIGYDVLVYLLEQSFLGMRMPMIAVHKGDFDTRARMMPLLDAINNVRRRSP